MSEKLVGEIERHDTNERHGKYAQEVEDSDDHMTNNNHDSQTLVVKQCEGKKADTNVPRSLGSKINKRNCGKAKSVSQKTYLKKIRKH